MEQAYNVCPYCHTSEVELDYTETIDFTCDGEVSQEGNCPKCGSTFEAVLNITFVRHDLQQDGDPTEIIG